MKRLKVLLAVALIACIPFAYGQLIYGNTFPFWNVTGPLTVTGTSSLAAVTATTISGTTIAGTAVTGSASLGAPIVTTSGYYSTPAPRTVTADATIAVTDSYVIANKAGTTTMTLPAAASFTGRRLCFKTSQAQTVVSVASDVVPLITAAAGTAILAATAGKWACMVSDATNWVILEAN